MDLITKQQIKQLKINGLSENRGKDNKPVVKIFAKNTRMMWLFSEIVNDQEFFGLCDSGTGNINLSYVHFNDLASLERQFDISICIDKGFEGIYPISVYESAALLKGKITINEKDLNSAYEKLRHIKNTNNTPLPETLMAFTISSDRKQISNRKF